MTVYALTKLAHVLTAVLSMGLVTASVIVTRASSGIAPTALRPIIRAATVGIVLMLASGALLDHLVAGAFHGARWFRIGVAWTLAAGIALTYSRRVTARASAGELSSDHARHRLHVASWIAFGCIAAAVVVMMRRP